MGLSTITSPALILYPLLSLQPSIVKNPMTSIEIPVEKLSIQYSRAGGPGGQHVNKVETKVEIRFVLEEADWIPQPVKERLATLVKVSKAGEVIISSSKSRSRQKNMEDCLGKLSSLLTQAGQVPKKRRATKPSRSAQNRRVETKKKRGQRKQERNWKADDH